MITKKCKNCNNVFECETEEEMGKHFYKKDGYFLNSCKKCVRKKHHDLYAEGKYNYYKKKKELNREYNGQIYKIPR